MKAAYLVTIDPSSSVTGYAVFDHGNRLIEHGLLRPERVKDPTNTRIETMSAEMRRVIAEYAPPHVVIEDTSGKVSARHGKGGGAGLAVYGKAVGYLMAEAKSCKGVKVSAVLENDWTEGIAKSTRTNTIATRYREYSRDKDKGGDAADAIGLGLWWLRQQSSAA